MKEQSRILLEIQEADLEIARLEKQLAEMPEKRAILEARKRISDIESLEERTSAFVAQIEKGVAREEDEVSAISAKMESEQAKLLSGKITNPKEVQHISNELDMLRRQKDDLETSILGEMERREAALEQTAKVDAALESARAKEAELVEGFKGKGGTLQRGIAEQNALRDSGLAALDPDTRSTYESHRSARAGVIIGVLSGSTCGACRMELPAETVHELLERHPVAECPLCRRILLTVDPRTEDPSDG